MPDKKTRSDDSKQKPSLSSTPPKTTRAKSPRAKVTRVTTKAKQPRELGGSLSISETVGTKDMNDRIAKRAYELHQQRGYQHGYDFEDWLQAEREILS